MYTTQAFVSIVGFIGIIKFKQLLLTARILEWYIISSIIVDIIVDVMIYKTIHTYAIATFFNVLELFLFVRIFYLSRTSKLNGTLLWVGFFLFLLVWTIGKFTFEPLTGWDKYTGSLTQIIQIGFGGWILLGLLKETNFILKEDVRFWILSGIVLYAAATFLFFGFFTEMLITDRLILRTIFRLNDVFIVIQYIFFLRAFLCKPVSAGIIHQSQTTNKENLN